MYLHKMFFNPFICNAYNYITTMENSKFETFFAIFTADTASDLLIL